MVYFTPMDLHTQVGEYGKKYNLDLDGKKISECIEIIREYCPKLHTNSELREFALKNLKIIEKEYGFKALRLFVYDYCKDNLLESYTGPDRLQEKYMKLLEHIKNFHFELYNEQMDLVLDHYIYSSELENVYDEEYGFIKDFNCRLYSMIKTIHNVNYNPEIIQVLKPYLKNGLIFANAKYYLKKDFTDVNILKMLYEHLAEENFDEFIVQARNICTDYDGYGNEYWIHQYSESWTDEDGIYYHRSWEPKHTIDDYIRLGLPED